MQCGLETNLKPVLYCLKRKKLGSVNGMDRTLKFGDEIESIYQLLVMKISTHRIHNFEWNFN